MKTLLIILFGLFSTNLVAQTNTTVDTDGNGLIEINNLEMLNAIRFQLDSTSYKATAEATTGITRGCPDDRCIGYELTRKLDFNDDDSYSSTANRIVWTTGEGWQPIGASLSNSFTGKFEGNGFTISNLTINRSRTNGVGLFGYTGSGAEIANVGLLNVDITETSFGVGSLVGQNSGAIMNSYAMGSVRGSFSVGGLVGRNNGTIMNSYALGSVRGSSLYYSEVGGLVGINSGTITNSYATGSVTGFSPIGGLIGINFSDGTITNSYATGSVIGFSSRVGGLVGINSGTITNSYWDVDASGIQTSADGTSKTTVALQSPTTSTGIYNSWSNDNWDFGTSGQYPVLKYADNPNTDSSECRRADTITKVPTCGSLLSPTLRYGLSELQLVQGYLSPDFDVVVPSYRGTVVSSASTIQFMPTAINPNAKIYITAHEEARGMAIDSGDESSIISLNANGITTITIAVENGGETTQTVVYTIYLNYYEFNEDVDRDDDGLIEINDLEELNAIRYQLDGAGYRESKKAPKIVIGCPNNICKGYELTGNLDFNEDDSYSLTANRIIWTMGAGWQPIGDSSSNLFTGQFEGNGYTISNLRIDKSSARGIGLFGYTGSGSEIANVGLLNIDIAGDNDVGSLVGSNNGTITNGYAMGSVSGNDGVGGLVGSNNGTITNSYAMGSVSGNDGVGGLAGGNSGTITNSYAMGSVSGDNYIGGLVGWNSSGGSITNSYAMGSVIGSDNNVVGGLVGDNSGTITNSYWDINTSGIAVSDGGTRQTTEELQSPTTATGIYSSWSTDDWDFGTSIQYPILKYTDSDILLPGQGIGLRDLEVLTSSVGLSPVFGASTTRYVINFVAETSEINLRLKAYNADATIKVVRRGEDADYFENKGNDEQSEPIPIDRNTALVITVTEADARNTIYTISTQELEVPDITSSENGVMDTDGMVNEGNRITLGANISGSDGNHRYGWTQIQGKPLTLFGSNTASPSFTIPTDYIASTISTSTDIVVQLTLEYSRFNLVFVSSKTLTIIKVNNETPRLNSGLTVDGFTLSFNDTRITDSDGSGTASGYQWQRRDINMDGWVDIDFATTTGYSVPRDDPDDRLYRVRVTYTDSQGYDVTKNVVAIGFRKDVDIDNDGLIEINDLETLNAIRFQLVGSHLQLSSSATPIDNGCQPDGCKGYELTRNLDFNDDDSYSSTANRIIWTTGEGWQPIGDSSNPFAGQFEGNGFTISNLTINRDRTNGVGLFGYTGSGGAEIANIGLLNVDIRGNYDVGSLVGRNDDSNITNSYATSSVIGRGRRIGGLVGYHWFSSITNSYATGSVSGVGSQMGGLVGSNFSGAITNSYATSSVIGRGGRIGSLVGYNDGGSITNSYATGHVSGDDDVGGLVGENLRSFISSSITNSYWDINTSGITVSDGGTRQTTEELQSPTTATGIYSSWGNDDWDFGTSSQYPILQYTDSNTLLSGQGVGLRDLEVLTSGAGLSPTFGASTTHYVINFVAETSYINLQLRAYNADATIRVVRRGENLDYFENRGSDGESEPIPIDEDTVLVITVTEAAPSTDTNTYTISTQELEISDIAEILSITVSGNGVMDTDDMVNEGSRITLGADIIGGGNYRYEWTQIQGKPLTLLGSNTASPSFTIPTDYIASVISTSTDIVVQLTLEYGQFNLVSVLSKTITIIKVNNETPRLDSGLTVNGLTLSFDDTRITDLDGSGTASAYQWQRRDINMDSWVDIDFATTTGYSVPRDDLDDRRYRVRVTYTDLQGYDVTKNVVAIGFRKDVDVDDDGLIEIYYLEQLDAIRYALDGSGYITNAMATTNTLGCPNGGCSGYELMRDLDFMNDDSYSSTANRITWTTGSGWQPIGDSSSPFTGQFEGNGFTISNLTINRGRTNGVGLFGYTGSGAEIANVGLLNVDITGTSSNVGGLVGVNGGIITNSFATGSISGDSNVGGLVGGNSGTITNSYATGHISGDKDVGSLAGGNSGTITNSYATGSVRGTLFGVGGLAGGNSGTITNSYATGSVRGTSLSASDLGGLVGSNSGTITNSYWDIDTSGIQTSADGTSKTTVALQSPTTATGIYSSWGGDNWDFGTSSQYPILRYTDNPNTDSSECRRAGTTKTDLPVCGSLLLPTLRYGLSELQLVNGNLSPDFDVVVPNYGGTVVNSTSTIQFRPTAINSDAKVYITANEETRGIAIDSGGESGRISLNTSEINRITIEVENSGETTQAVIYTLYLNYYEFIGDVDRDDDGLIEIDDLEGLNAMRYQLDGAGYRERETAPKVAVGCPNNRCEGYELMRNLDFNDSDSYSSTIIYTTEAGWQPIGDFSNIFTSQFEGNGYTISNLTINRSSARGIGLFGYTGSGSKIANVGLLNIDITGDNDVGSLVGSNNGTITNSYATGAVSGDNDVGSLVGSNNGTITNSYATGAVSGDNDIGGLVGSNNSTIANSYATGTVSGDNDIGGLVGSTNGTITNSYWDVDVSGIQTSAGGTSKTTVELQSPTAPGSASNELYYNWSSDDWDFGTSIQYPILKHADRDVLLSGQGVGLRDLEMLTSGAGLSPTFGASTTRYVINFIAETSDINLKLRAYNADAIIEVIRRGEGRNYFENKGIDGQSEPISIDRNTELVITVTEANAGTTIYTISTQALEMPDIAEISGITLSKNGVMDTDDTVNEGSRITLGANINGGGNYRYEWTQIQGEPLTLVGSNTASPSFTIPTDYIASTTSTSTDIVVQLTLEYGQFNLVSMSSKTITIIKVNNETPRLDAGFTVNGLTLSFDDTRVTDSDGNGTASAYQWQRQDINMDSWVDIDSETTKDYAVPRYDPHGRLYRVRVTYTDAQGYGVTENVGGFRKDVDIDNDGLIEINDLEALNAIRFQLDGTSYRATDGVTGITDGCPNDRCRGYELARNLDFDDDDSYSSTTNRVVWTTGEGWEPIGRYVGSNNANNDPFIAVFEGNDYIISNLMINRPATNDAGLFGYISDQSTILNTGLLNIEVRGNISVGGLVGRSSGSITNSYATGSVTGGSNQVGGLVGVLSSGSITDSYATGSVTGNGGRVGGLIGFNYSRGTITNSYATGSVTGSGSDVGGLVGRGGFVSITNSYATGSVTGSGDSIGGLVGFFSHEGAITNSYATGSVRGYDDNVGGLVGVLSSGSIANSYATGSVTGSKNNVGGLVGYYLHSSINNSYATGSVIGNGSNVGGLVGYNLDSDPITNSYWDINTSGIETGANGQGKTTEELQEPTTTTGIYSSWSTEVWDFGTTKQYPVLKYSDGTLIPNQPREQSDLSQRLSVEVAGVPTSDLNEGERITLTALPSSNASNILLSYRWEQISGEVLPIDSTTLNMITLEVPEDYVAVDANTVNLTIILDVFSDVGNIVQPVSITIAKRNNGKIAALSPPTSPDEGDLIAPAIDLSGDPDGSVSNINYQWQSRESTRTAWVNVQTMSDTPETYPIPNGIRDGTQYRVVVSYTDGQGYSEEVISQVIVYQRIYSPAEVANLTSCGTTDIDQNDDGLIEICNLEGINAIRYQMDGTGYKVSGLVTKITAGCPATGCKGYELTRDLDFDDDDSYNSTANRIVWTTGEGWEPIGRYVGSNNANNDPFIAVLEGNDYTISNLMINRAATDDVGLFSYISDQSKIRNIGLLNVEVSGNIRVGGLVGRSNGNITNNYATGSVMGIDHSVGGLVGYSEGGITDSYAMGSVSGGSGGGLVGSSSGSITDSYATGSVSVSGNGGGLVGGSSRGNITNSFATGSVTGGGGVGGLVGSGSFGSITNSFATGSVTGSGEDVGGLVGSFSSGSITNSFATGSVRGYDIYVGGLVGVLSSGSITNSYATGSVTGSSDNVGGLVGYYLGNSITNSYATGSVAGSGSNVGGLVGYNLSRGSPITNSYWDINTSGITVSDGGTRRTTEELQEPTTTTGIYRSWDSDNWDFGTSIQYPILKYTDSNTLLPNQGIGLRDLELLTFGPTLSPIFGASTTHYVISFPAVTSRINLQLRAYNADATIKVVNRGEQRDYFENKGSAGQSEPIPIDRNTELVITVTEAAPTTDTTTYTISTHELELSDIEEISGITVSENDVMDTDDTVNEGSRITLGADIRGGGNYRYEWTQIQGKPLVLSGSNIASPSFTIPTDYIASTISTSTDIVVQLTLEYGQFNLVSVLSKTITIIKVDNEPPRLDAGLTVNGLTLNFDDKRVTDPDGNGTASAYQWQRQDINMDSWVDIDSATTTSYSVPRDDPHGRLYGIRVTYTDAQGYEVTENVVAIGFRKDVDIDNNGLIEINHLETLNAIRFQLDGTSYRGITDGCPNNVCRGYELTRNLDFNDDASYIFPTANRIIWTKGEGWQPIGAMGVFSSRPFTGKFEGNGFTISNLMINRDETNGVGLFGYAASSAEIANVGLLNGNIRGNYDVGSLVGRNGTGFVVGDGIGLVGNNGGIIKNSYATGNVRARSGHVGGLVGNNAGIIMNSYAKGTVVSVEEDGLDPSGVGGLVGKNNVGSITNSYATGSVRGTFSLVGGLVGYNLYSSITNSYARAVVGSSRESGRLGGLVGLNEHSSITNSYATGSVTGGSISSLGGLVGSLSIGSIRGSITNSYWDVDVSGIQTSAGGTGQTTEELQSPTMATGIYSSWGGDNWDFGTSKQYPILQYTDSNILLPGQGVGLRDLEVLTSGARLNSIFGASATHYVMSFLATRTSEISLRLKAYNADATIKVVRRGEKRDYFENKGSEGQSETVSIDRNTALVITVTESDASSTINTISTQVEANIAPTIMIAPSTSQTLPLNSTAHIVVSVADDNFNLDDIVTLEAMSSSQTIVSVEPAQVVGITTDTSRIFMLSAEQSGTATIKFIATDSGGLNDSETFSVRVNTAPMLRGIPEQPIRLLEGLSTELDVAISDANADDILDVRIDTSDSMIATATIIATNGTTQTLKVSGVSAGSAMITVTVDDGRDVANSEISEQFEVHVEANTTPTIMITPSLGQTLPVNSTTHIVVLVLDDNFNLDDIVTLDALSSSPTIVLVAPARVAGITTDTITTFMLNARQHGTATITFTATDSGGSSDSATVSVNVITTIRVHVKVFLEGLLQ